MSKSRDILILQAFPEELRLASARESSGVVEVSHLSSFWCRSKSDDTSALCDQTTLDALAAYVEDRGWAQRELICIVGGPGVSCQHYDLPPLKGPALRQAAILKLKQQLHFEVSDAVVAVDIALNALGVPENQVRVDVSAIQRDIAQAAIDAASTARLHLTAITAAPAAYARLAADWTSETSGSRAILQIEEKSCTLVILNGPTPFVTTELPMGAGDITTALMRPIISGENVIQLDESAAAALRNEIGVPSPRQDVVSLQVTGDRILPLLEPVLQKLSKNITQWLSFAATCNNGQAITSVALTGVGGTIHGLAASLASRLGLEVTSGPRIGDHVRLGAETDGVDVESLGLMVAGTRFWRELPDLIPEELRYRKRVNSIKRVLVWSGPFAAAVLFTFGLLFEQVGRTLAHEVAHNSSRLVEAQALIEGRAKMARQTETALNLAGQIEGFVECSPSWVGVFKELSLVLPSELRVLEYTSRTNASGMNLVVKAGVHTSKTQRTFDDVVAQTLLLLERSSFFKRVEMSVNRTPQSEDLGAAGVLTIELELAYGARKANG